MGLVKMRMLLLESWHFAVIVNGLWCGSYWLMEHINSFMAAMANRHCSLVVLQW